jgi:hypothetical protein
MIFTFTQRTPNQNQKSNQVLGSLLHLSLTSNSTSTPLTPTLGTRPLWRGRDDDHHDGVMERPPPWLAGLEVEDAAVPTGPQHEVAALAENNIGARSPPLMYPAGCS